jgi:hypothetical protein
MKKTKQGVYIYILSTVADREWQLLEAIRKESF